MKSHYSWLQSGLRAAGKIKNNLAEVGFDLGRYLSKGTRAVVWKAEF
jgi:hypothetical protein